MPADAHDVAPDWAGCASPGLRAHIEDGDILHEP
jgi:hypothetical protein